MGRHGFPRRFFALDSWLILLLAPNGGSRWNSQEDIEMPDVHILWLAGRSVDQKRKVVEGITKVLVDEAGAKSESTHIVFVDIPHTDFASNGMLVSDKNKKA
jgi:4-oxalocrotonate tautomerase